jgi:deoxyribodipyrimidine photolyase
MTVFWFRRDLRLEDNVGLFHALNSGEEVLPIFIFDEMLYFLSFKKTMHVSLLSTNNWKNYSWNCKKSENHLLFFMENH